MFFSAGGTVTYLVYLICIWGVILINTCLTLISKKDKESPSEVISNFKKSDSYCDHTIILSFTDVNKEYYIDNYDLSSVYFNEDYCLKIAVFNTPPGSEPFFNGKILLRAPPLHV